MKKILFMAASALLILSCTKDPDLTVYEGSYKVDNNTVITVNNHSVNFAPRPQPGLPSQEVSVQVTVPSM